MSEMRTRSGKLDTEANFVFEERKDNLREANMGSDPEERKSDDMSEGEESESITERGSLPKVKTKLEFLLEK